MSSEATVIVVGAGCIGLSTAVELLRKGFPVLLLADHLPADPLDPEYASLAAGAHHLSFAANDDFRQRLFDRRTFDRYWQQTEDADEAAKLGVMRLTQTEYYKGDVHVRFFETLPDFKVNDPSTLPAFAEHSVSFTSVTIEPARYLPYLLDDFTRLGGTFQRIPRLSTLAAALKHHPSAPLAIINCTGLGARSLEDVKDEAVHPVRGQVLLLDAPWVKSGWTRQIGTLGGGEGGSRTYVIPRASGEVIVGGTMVANDWERKPRPETTVDILQRALEICPQLALPPAPAAAVSDLSTLLRAEVVGFRPARTGGIRLEKDTNTVAGVTMVHSYGHGGAGWQSMWGCAEEVAAIVGECAREQRK